MVPPVRFALTLCRILSPLPLLLGYGSRKIRRIRSARKTRLHLGLRILFTSASRRLSLGSIPEDASCNVITYSRSRISPGVPPFCAIAPLIISVSLSRGLRLTLASGVDSKKRSSNRELRASLISVPERVGHGQTEVILTTILVDQRVPYRPVSERTCF